MKDISKFMKNIDTENILDLEQVSRINSKNISRIDLENILKIGDTYKYKELCFLFNEKCKTGQAKINQLNRWRESFSWENPTKQTYKIIDIHHELYCIDDGRKYNGGARLGSGAKEKLKEEFDYLFALFIRRELNRNIYNHQTNLYQIYFSNNEISKYFGLYGDRFYDAPADFRDILQNNNIDNSDKIDEHDALTSKFDNAWKDINKKIIEKRRSLIYHKIDKIEGIAFDYGIIAYSDTVNKKFVYMDSYLDVWNRYMETYIKNNKLNALPDVVDKGLYNDMILFISNMFDGYERVEKIRRLTLLSDYGVGEYDKSQYDSYRQRFNDVIVNSLISFFGKKISDVDGLKMYRYIIDKYVRI